MQYRSISHVCRDFRLEASLKIFQSRTEQPYRGSFFHYSLKSFFTSCLASSSGTSVPSETKERVSVRKVISSSLMYIRVYATLCIAQLNCWYWYLRLSCAAWVKVVIFFSRRIQTYSTNTKKWFRYSISEIVKICKTPLITNLDCRSSNWLHTSFATKWLLTAHKEHNILN